MQCNDAMRERRRPTSLNQSRGGRGGGRYNRGGRFNLRRPFVVLPITRGGECVESVRSRFGFAELRNVHDARVAVRRSILAEVLVERRYVGLVRRPVYIPVLATTLAVKSGDTTGAEALGGSVLALRHRCVIPRRRIGAVLLAVSVPHRGRRRGHIGLDREVEFQSLILTAAKRSPFQEEFVIRNAAINILTEVHLDVLARLDDKAAATLVNAGAAGNVARDDSFRSVHRRDHTSLRQSNLVVVVAIHVGRKVCLKCCCILTPYSAKVANGGTVICLSPSAICLALRSLSVSCGAAL